MTFFSAGWRSLTLWKGHFTIQKRSTAELPANYVILFKSKSNPFSPTVDGRNPAPVGRYFYPTIYKILAPLQVVVWDFWAINSITTALSINFPQVFLLVKSSQAAATTMHLPHFLLLNGHPLLLLLCLGQLPGTPVDSMEKYLAGAESSSGLVGKMVILAAHQAHHKNAQPQIFSAHF